MTTVRGRIRNDLHHAPDDAGLLGGDQRSATGFNLRGHRCPVVAELGVIDGHEEAERGAGREPVAQEL